MRKKLNSEFYFTHHQDENINLSVIINYERNTYDIVQPNQEGIMIHHNNDNTDTNFKYLALAIEALRFVQCELYESKE